MTNNYQFYCVPSWSTCKKAKAWLEQNSIQFTYLDLLKEPPGLKELKQIAKINNLNVKDLINLKSQVFKKLKPDLKNMDEKSIANLINENPRILLRPILTDGETLVLGFKENQYKELIRWNLPNIIPNNFCLTTN